MEKEDIIRMQLKQESVASAIHLMKEAVTGRGTIELELMDKREVFSLLQDHLYKAMLKVYGLEETNESKEKTE